MSKYYKWFRPLCLALVLGVSAITPATWAQTCDIPVVAGLPTYLSGTTVTIKMVPAANADLTEVCYFDVSDGIVKGCYNEDPLLSLAAESTTVVFEGLVSGHTYGFFAKAYCSALVDTSFSDTVFTTLDNTPPDSVKYDSTGTGPTRAVAGMGGLISVDWQGVGDNESGMMLYEVQRKVGSSDWTVMDTLADTDPDDTYLYQEQLSDDNGLIEGLATLYEIIAVDAVGNRRGGRGTAAVLPDSSAPPIPTLSVGYDYDDGSTRYTRGTFLEITGASNSISPAERADSIRFEIARDDLGNFTGGVVDWTYFTTGWLPYSPSAVSRALSLLPPDIDTAYVNGHTYYVRCSAKDNLGHLSGWSDTLAVVMDPLPPGDISNLTVTPNPYVPGVDSAAMVVAWDAAVEAVSGIEWYYIYRSTTAGDWGGPIDSVPGGSTEYRDHYSDVDHLDRDRYYYRILSIDNVGNMRTTTDWIGDDLPHVPPRLTDLHCDVEVLGRCYRTAPSFIAYFAPLNDTTGVARYNLRWNSTDVDIEDLGSDSVRISVPADSLRIQVRLQTVFADSSRSRWSEDRMVTIMTRKPDPLDKLTVTNQHTTEYYLGNIYLNWEKPDSADIFAYRVYRFDSLGQRLSLGTRPATPFDSSDYTDIYDSDLWLAYSPLTTYEWYAYTVSPINWVGTEADYIPGVSPVDSAFCNRGPTIDSAVAGGDSIRIFWSRPLPNLADDYGNLIEVTRLREGTEDSVYGVFENFATDRFTLLNLSLANDSGRFVFRVKEYEREAGLVDTAGGTLETAWSRPDTIPFNSMPPAPRNFALIPQPLDPTLAGSSSARIYVAWEFDRPELVDSFIVTRNGTDTTIMAETGTTAYGFMDSDLDEANAYNYSILAFDKFRQPSEAVSAATMVDPIWTYTPQVDSILPPYFNITSLSINWHWRDGEGDVMETDPFGADSVIVQLSARADFSDSYDRLELRTGAYDGPVITSLDGSGVTPDNPILYLRIRAKDRFGNENQSIWSTDYFETITGLYDPRTPEPVTVLAIDSSRAVMTPDEDSVAIFLTWGQVEDRGGSGRRNYRVYRTEPGDDTFYLVDSTVDTTYVDGVRVGDASNCDFQYRIHAVDNVGNERTADNHEACLEVLTRPIITGDSLDASTRFLTVFWQNNDALAADSFQLEAAQHPNHFTLGIPEEAGNFGVVPGTATSFTFPNSWDQAITTIYYRVKAIRGTKESGWTDSAWTIATDVARDENETIPETWTLGQNYPNPFNPTTDIPFGLPTRAHVRLRVFNVLGMTVATLVDEELPAGNYVARWNGRDEHRQQVASGIYFYRLEYEAGAINRKMVLIR